MAGLAIYFTLVLARAGTGVMVLPLFGGQNTPRLVRLGFALALAVFWTAKLGLPDVATLAHLNAMAWPMVALALAREVLLGALLGLAFSLFLLPARVAVATSNFSPGAATRMQTCR